VYLSTELGINIAYPTFMAWNPPCKVWIGPVEHVDQSACLVIKRIDEL
jgi:hypothetical protein